MPRLPPVALPLVKGGGAAELPPPPASGVPLGGAPPEDGVPFTTGPPSDLAGPLQAARSTAPMSHRPKMPPCDALSTALKLASSCPGERMPQTAEPDKAAAPPDCGSGWATGVVSFSNG